MDRNYTVKITKTGRYVTKCDEHWYETDLMPLKTFSKEEAERIAVQLKSHYVYDVVVSNGEDSRHHKREKKENPIEQEILF